MARPDAFHNFRRDLSDEARVVRFPIAGLPPGVEELLVIGQIDRLLQPTDKRRQGEISNVELFVPK